MLSAAWGGVTETVGKCLAFGYPAVVEAIVLYCVCSEFFRSRVQASEPTEPTEPTDTKECETHDEEKLTVKKGIEMIKEFSIKIAEHFVIGHTLLCLEGIVPSL